MKLNKQRLEALCSLDDEALWREIRTIGESYGISLPQKAPPSAELQRVRDAVAGGGRMNLAEAVKIINAQRREKK